ncbi:MAG: hypothetical protein NTV86_22065 [Planctomycetota bacterium]|nr:hypothetical protein [Planctomycetota bacterium]
MMKTLWFTVCCLVALTASLAGAAPAVDAQAERAAAAKAEQAGDSDAALLHYENVYDSTPCTPEEYVALRRKFEELQPKAKRNDDPAKAPVYHVRSFAFRTLQVGDRKNTYNEKQLKDFEKVHVAWAQEVWKASSGQCRLDWKATVIDKPLTRFDGFPSPEACLLFFEALKPGEADHVTAYTLSSGFPSSCWGGTMGSVCKGATYSGFNDGGDGGTCGDAEVQVHEWLHALEMTLKWHQMYPDAIFPNPDAGCNCGPKCWQPTPGKNSLYDWYRHILGVHMTRKMWREVSLTRPSENPWLAKLKLCPRFATLGPFDGGGKDKNGFDAAFIDEANLKPALGKQEGGRTWRAADRAGAFLNLAGVYYPVERQAAYAAVIARSPEARAAQVRLGAASACKAWHNGKPIVSAPAWRGCGHDQDKVDVQLVKGDNLFVIKAVNSGNVDWADWGVNLRLTDAAGQPLEGIEYALPGEAAAGPR